MCNNVSKCANLQELKKKTTIWKKLHENNKIIFLRLISVKKAGAHKETKTTKQSFKKGKLLLEKEMEEMIK